MFRQIEKWFLKSFGFLRNPTEFDPAQLNPYQAQLLHRLLKAQEANAEPSDSGKVNSTNRAVFERGIPYNFKDNGNEYVIKFSKKLVRRQRKHPHHHANPYLYTVYVDDKKHLKGRGAFGKVYQVLGKLKYSADNNALSYHPTTNPEKENVIKEQVISLTTSQMFLPQHAKIQAYNYRVEKHTSENTIAKQFDYLHAKEITFQEEDGVKTTSYMEMRDLGEDFIKFFTRMRGTLTLEQLFLICINSLEALMDFNRSGFIHRDIKPDNMMIKNWVIKFTDMGASRRINVKDGKKTGTPIFLAPEMVAVPQEADVQADAYSLGLLLRAILEDEEVVAEGNRTLSVILQQKKTAYTNKEAPKAVRFSKKMNTLLAKKISYNARQILIDTLEGLTHPDPMQRFTCDIALNNFREIVSASNLTIVEAPAYNSDDEKYIFPENSQKDNLVFSPSIPNNDDPAWLTRMREIVANIAIRHCGVTAKSKYVTRAIGLVDWAIAQRTAEDNQENAAESNNNKTVLDMFKVLMICCFQNNNGNDFFRSAQTKTGLYFEAALRKPEYNGGPTAALREMLFGANYGAEIKKLPNYIDIVNSLYEQQINKYPLDGNNNRICDFQKVKMINGVKIAYTDDHTTKIDVLRTASLLMKSTHPTLASVPLTVQGLCRDQLFREYSAIFQKKNNSLKKTAN